MSKLTLDLPPGISPQSVKAYCLAQQLERWLRELIYLELKANYGTEWCMKLIEALKRSKGLGIPPEKSFKKDQKHQHMSTPENDPLWYLSFDSLIKLIFDKILWGLFKPYLMNKDLLRAKLGEIQLIRNRIAHFRTLHLDDLDRLKSLLRDLDKGFWKFCTSYNEEQGFISKLLRDPVHKHFSDRIHSGYAQVGPNHWGKVANRLGVKLDIDLSYLIRPGRRLPWNSKIRGAKGVLYDFKFTCAHLSGNLGYLDYPRILAATKAHHPLAAHIMLDELQGILRITFPAVLSEKEIIKAADSFYDACYTYRGKIYGHQSDNSAFDKKHIRKTNHNFEIMAAEWPHYVLPPSHPFTFLCPENPCKIFQLTV